MLNEAPSHRVVRLRGPYEEAAARLFLKKRERHCRVAHILFTWAHFFGLARTCRTVSRCLGGMDIRGAGARGFDRGFPVRMKPKHRGLAWCVCPEASPGRTRLPSPTCKEREEKQRATVTSFASPYQRMTLEKEKTPMNQRSIIPNPLKGLLEKLQATLESK